MQGIETTCNAEKTRRSTPYKSFRSFPFSSVRSPSTFINLAIRSFYALPLPSLSAIASRIASGASLNDNLSVHLIEPAVFNEELPIKLTMPFLPGS